MGEALTLTPFDFLALFSIGIVFLLFIKNKLTPRRPDVELSSSVSAQAATSQKEIKCFSREEVAKHNRKDDCWLIINGKIYDVTPYVPDHVGGEESISHRAGLDNTEGFFGKQHPDKVRHMVEEYFVGHLIDENKDH